MDVAVSETWQRRFERFPILQSLLRQVLYRAFERLNGSLNRPKARQRLEASARRNIERAVEDEALRKKLTPDFAIGCKRILQSNSWYRALARPNVTVVSGVAEVQGNTIIATDGSSCEVDLIIFGTGFEVANPPVAEIIIGTSGRSLADQWQGSPEVYLGTTAPDAPNCFLTFGPNLYTFSSAFVMIEAQLDYIMDALRQAGARKITSLSIRADVCRSYNEVVQAARCPILVRGGGKKPIGTVFSEAYAYLQQGAHGLVYGRNIYQHPNPARIVAAFMAMIHEGANVERALAIYEGR
jgi:cation diffusion facilitator CzcD-associated flavoprotein CzcO